MIGFAHYLTQHALTGLTTVAATAAATFTWRAARDGRLTRRVVLGESQVPKDEGLVGGLRKVRTRVSDTEERANANQERLDRHELALREGDLLPINDDDEADGE